MRVILFQERFANSVLLETKLQTIRRRACCKPGDVLSLRMWTGLPYRSKQWEIHRRLCRAVKPIRMYFERDGKFIIEISGRRVSNRDEFAKADGFTSLEDMAQWFVRTHGAEDIQGELIVWHKGKAPQEEKKDEVVDALERIVQGCEEDLEEMKTYPEKRGLILAGIAGNKAIAESALARYKARKARKDRSRESVNK
jgi:hypothetical protein